VPVDLNQIGPPKQYPRAGLQIRLWSIVWIACALLIGGAVILFWPRNVPAQGLLFWSLLTGLPNAAYIALVAWNRTCIESAHLHVLFYNDHRERHRAELIAEGQRALLVLGYAYSLPLKNGTFAQSVIAGPALLASRPTRDGSAILRHTRLPENDEAIDTPEPSAIDVLTQLPLTREGKLIAHVLTPLVDTITSMIANGTPPAIRLITQDDSSTGPALAQIDFVMRAFDLPTLDCKAVGSSAGLMLIDAWLDAKSPRPLLVIAIELHEIAPPGSAEGGVSLLLASQGTCLPQKIAPCASIHRPVEVPDDNLAKGIALTALWGNVDPQAIEHAWITGFGEQEHVLIADACRRTGLTTLVNHSRRHNPDNAIGYTGAAAAWLSIAAAIEHGVLNPQIILNRTQAVEAAVVRVHSSPP
jgi:hypothetical protein